MKKSWQTKTLGEICGFVRGPFGGSLKKSVFVQDGFAVYEQQHAIYNQFEDVRYFIDDTKFKEMKRFEIYPNDLIMSCSGTMGKVAIVPNNIRPGIINQALLKLTPSDSVLPEFLKYWMESTNFQESLKEQSGGAAIQNVASVSILKEIGIPLPPLPDQHRIVRILDEAFDGIATAKANAEKNLQNARELFESELDAVFSQRGKGWIDSKLGDVCYKITDGTHITPTYTKTGVPFLSVKNLTHGIIDFSNTKFISAKEHEFLTKNNKPMRDDILYTKVGTTGIAKVVDVDDEFSIFVSVALLKIKHDVIFNLYLEHFLNAPYAREQAKKRTRGMANKNLVIADIKEINIHFPKTLAEQKTIVARLDSLRAETQHLESIYQRKLDALDELKKSLLHQAFNGEL